MLVRLYGIMADWPVNTNELVGRVVPMISLWCLWLVSAPHSPPPSIGAIIFVEGEFGSYQEPSLSLPKWFGLEPSSWPSNVAIWEALWYFGGPRKNDVQRIAGSFRNP
jgi:hypothetical protein